MRDETCIPLMMRLIGEGRPLVEVRLTLLLVLPVVLLWSMMGFASPAPAYIVLQGPEPAGPVPGPARRIRCTGGIVPGIPGTAGGIRALFAR